MQLMHVISICIFVYHLIKEVQHWHEKRAMHEHFKKNYAEWLQQEKWLVQKLHASSEREKLAIIDMEKKQLDIQEVHQKNEAKRLDYISIPENGNFTNDQRAARELLREQEQIDSQATETFQ